VVQISIKKIENELEQHKIDRNSLNKKLFPSKTAQNGLNFLTKENEKCFINNHSLPEVRNVIKVIYILLKEQYVEIEGGESFNQVDNLVNNIMPKHKVESLSKCFK
jgi:hypothetical protein